MLVLGFDGKFIRDVIFDLEKEKNICVKKWFVSDSTIQEKDCTPQMINWRSIYEEMSEYQFTDYCPKHIYDEVYKHLPAFYDNLVRESYFENREIGELNNVINVYINFLYNMIVKENINYVLFSDIPHGAYAPILYFMAKVMKIKTLMCLPSYMISHFLFCYDLEDIGYFRLNNRYFDGGKYLAEVKHEYKKNVYWAPPPPFKEKFRAIFDFKAWVSERKTVFEAKSKKYAGFYDYSCRHILKFASRSYNKYVYKQYNKKIFKNKIVIGEKFVYFPLHLQPEMTTATLGKIYNDQILAIERLSTIIPNDWKIYVKENPLQTEYMRGRYFYKRLLLNPQVKCVENKTNTYELIEQCQFVATITGTAGWEAISGGKPALVFGLAWYRGLPGVVNYTENVKLDDILTTKIDHEIFNEEFQKLKANFIEGIVFEDVANHTQNLDIDTNKVKIKEFLAWAINDGYNDREVKR